MANYSLILLFLIQVQLCPAICADITKPPQCVPWCNKCPCVVFMAYYLDIVENTDSRERIAHVKKLQT